MRTLLCLLPLFLLPLLAVGQTDSLLVHEPFDYAPFNPLWCAPNGAGTGWVSEWRRETGDDAILLAGNLGAGEVDTGTHALIDFVRAGVRYNRFIDPIRDEGQELWMSVVLDFGAGDAAGNVGNVTLTRGGQQVFSFGRKFGNRRFGLVWPGAPDYATDVATDGLHRLVVLLAFSGDEDNEQAWLWIDPPADREPDPANADLAISADASPGLSINRGFSAIQLKVEGTPPLRVGYDELRLGTSFAAVSPAGVVSTTEDLLPYLPLTIFPNPTAGSLSIILPQAVPGPVGYELYDANGRQLLSQAGTYPGRELLLDLATLHLPTGIYTLRLKTSAYRSVARIVYTSRP